MPPTWIGLPLALAVNCLTCLVPTPNRLAAMIDTLPVVAWSGFGVGRSYWYQTTDTLPGLPAAIHGQSTVVPGWGTAIGFDQCTASLDDDSQIVFLPLPLLPWLGPGWSAHDSATLPALFSARDGKCVSTPCVRATGYSWNAPFPALKACTAFLSTAT